MCDYCDCRSHHAIASLSADHVALLGHLANLRRALAADDVVGARAAVVALHDGLDAHAAREERGVFRELAAARVEPSYVATFESDHDRLHALVDTALTPEWRDAAAALVTALERHIAAEESDLFPAAHQLLEPSQWDAIDALEADAQALRA